MKRNRREHGRILSVETKVRGSALAADYAAGVTTISVDDAGDFDEDGGWLYIGAQTVEYLSCDDDAGTIVLADPIAEAGEDGDPVHVWSDLYAEVVDYQEALVELDGEYDNPDPVVAELAEGVGELPEGDRGRAGESCVLRRVADDEWEVVGVGGRPKSSSGVLFYQNQHFVEQPGAQMFELTHEPVENSEHLYWNGVYQPASVWSRSGSVVTVPDTNNELRAGDYIDVEYAYRRGVSSGRGGAVLLDYESSGWKYLQVALTDDTDRSATGFDDSGWATGQAAFGALVAGIGDWPTPHTTWAQLTRMWLRRTVAATAGRDVQVFLRAEESVVVYWNGSQVHASAPGGAATAFDIPGASVLASNVLAVRASDDDGVAASRGGQSYIDVRIET